MDMKKVRMPNAGNVAVAILLMTMATATMAISVPADTTPDPFAFEDQVDVTAGMPAVSAPVIISGIDAATTVTVAGGEYSVGCTGTWTAGDGTIANGQTVCVRHSASFASLATTYTTLVVGGISDTFASTTESISIIPPDGDPDPFEFTPIDGVMPGVTVTSAPITLAGFDVALPIGAENGDLDIGCDGTIDASHTNDPLYVEAGTSVCVRHVASIHCGGTVTTTLYVGPGSSTFTTTTRTAAGGCVDSDDGGGTFAPITLLVCLLLLFRCRSARLRNPECNGSALAANPALQARRS